MARSLASGPYTAEQVAQVLASGHGILDPRFKLVPHDFDDVFNIGGEAGDGRTRSIFSYDAASGGVQGLRTLFNHPELVPRYYAKVLEGMDTWFNHAVLDPLIEQVMGGWVPAATINNVKGFRTGILMRS